MENRRVYAGEYAVVQFYKIAQCASGAGLVVHIVAHDS